MNQTIIINTVCIDGYVCLFGGGDQQQQQQQQQLVGSYILPLLCSSRKLCSIIINCIYTHCELCEHWKLRTFKSKHFMYMYIVRKIYRNISD